MRLGTRILTLCLVAISLGLPILSQAQRGSASYPYQMYQGREALTRKQWNAALFHFRYALVWNKNGTEAHSGLGYAYLGLDKKEQAVEEFDTALRLKPHFTEAERGLHRAHTPGEEEAAFRALEDQVQQQPDNADLHTSYAEALLARDRAEEAQREAETAVHLNPKLGHAYSALGRAALKQGNATEARQNLESAIQRDNTDDAAFTALGDLAMQQKEAREAVTSFRQAVYLVPDESEYRQKLIAALVAAGDEYQAKREQAILARQSQTVPPAPQGSEAK
jgi:Flp pilus assembly protein TadD